jgi:hypothetical protein
MKSQTANQVLALASVIRELREAKERLEGELNTFDDYVHRGGGDKLRFGVLVLGSSGQFWVSDAYVLNQMQRAARAAMLDQIEGVDQHLQRLELPKE